MYTSNAFALLALRSLYLLLSRSIQQLHYLRHAVALILGFVGVKMVRAAVGVWRWWHAVVGVEVARSLAHRAGEARPGR